MCSHIKIATPSQHSSRKEASSTLIHTNKRDSIQHQSTSVKTSWYFLKQHHGLVKEYTSVTNMNPTNVSSQMFSSIQGLKLYAYNKTLLQRHDNTKLQRQMLQRNMQKCPTLISFPPYRSYTTPLVFVQSSEMMML